MLTGLSLSLAGSTWLQPVKSKTRDQVLSPSNRDVRTRGPRLADEVDHGLTEK
jgi:hypothetical protein